MVGSAVDDGTCTRRDRALVETVFDNRRPGLGKPEGRIGQRIDGGHVGQAVIGGSQLVADLAHALRDIGDVLVLVNEVAGFVENHLHVEQAAAAVPFLHLRPGDDELAVGGNAHRGRGIGDSARTGSGCAGRTKVRAIDAHGVVHVRIRIVVGVGRRRADRLRAVATVVVAELEAAVGIDAQLRVDGCAVGEVETDIDRRRAVVIDRGAVPCRALRGAAPGNVGMRGVVDPGERYLRIAVAAGEGAGGKKKIHPGKGLQKHKCRRSARNRRPTPSIHHVLRDASAIWAQRVFTATRTRSQT